MLNVLILDNDPRRHQLLKREACSIVGACSPIFARTVEEGEEALLLKSRWDLLMLDHDLDGRVYVDSHDPTTGYQVAKFIVSNKIEFDRCILHSLNEEGARNMGRLLKENCGGSINYVPVIRMV